MERSLVRLIGRPGDVPVAKHVLARAEARHLQQMSDPLMCQEQTAIAQTFNEERFQEWEDRLKHERARAKVEEQKQIIVAADIAQAVVFADEAPFLFRLQKVMGRTSRGSSRSRSRGGDNESTSDGSSDSEAESYSVSSQDGMLGHDGLKGAFRLKGYRPRLGHQTNPAQLAGKGRFFSDLLMTWALSAMDSFRCTLPGRAPDVQPLRHNVEDLADEAPDPVRKDLQGFCPYLHELPAAFTTFWHQLHGAALLVERPGRKLKFTPAPVTEASPEGTSRGLCLQLALFRQVVSGTAGLPFLLPGSENGFGTALLLWQILSQVANSCPTLISSYFEWASELAVQAGQPRRGRALLQLGAPIRTMALSRALFRPDETRAAKEAQSTLSTKYASKLRDLHMKYGLEEKEWQIVDTDHQNWVVVHSLCDSNFAGGNLENVTFGITEHNHKSYAERWGYEYTMHTQTPLAEEEPQFGKLQIAIDVLSSEKPPDWFLWLDCDALVTNRSISVESLLRTYQLSEKDFVVAEEVSGINSGVFLVRGGAEGRGLRFLEEAMQSDWRFVWDQTMLLQQMARESDLFGATMCSDAASDFRWAPHFGLVPQHAMNLYGEGSALQWGASAWKPGDFILHLAGCPLTESECHGTFEEIAAWAEAHN
ncbi:unnamed protein product [Symbiodinium sp. CCMP2456]|nr:unnamed protein product [Symbiodinium sp. CCMP2456]